MIKWPVKKIGDNRVMDVTIGKCGKIDGHIRAPPSKSYTHRALIIGGLAIGDSTIYSQLDADDTRMTAKALMNLGIRSVWSDDTVVVSGTGGDLHCYEMIDIGDSGTSMRLLTGISLLSDNPVILTGSTRMKDRPLLILVDALRSAGGKIEYLEKEGFPPVKIDGSFNGGTIRIDGSVSSQFISSLLILSPFAKNDTKIIINGNMVSEPYIDLTLSLMKHFGVTVKKDKNSFLIKSNQRYVADSYRVEGDYSSASYWFALAAISGGTVTVSGLNKDSLQGDRKIITLLEMMGCNVTWNLDSCTVSGNENISGINVDMSDCPDIIQTIAVVASVAKEKSTITGVHHLRAKESDRIEALKRGLTSLGCSVLVSDTEDKITIIPGHLHGSIINPENDHRTAMSFAVLSAKVEGITILDAGCVTKSYPEFWRNFKTLWQSGE